MKRKLSKKTIWILVAILAPPGLALFVYLVGKLVMSLWNGLLPPLFGFPEITFWQGLGLLLLSRIFFGGMGSGGSGSPQSRGRRSGGPERIREGICERWGEKDTSGPAGT